MKTVDILTAREETVVRGYVRGLNGKEIADECCMAYRTVVNHTQNAYDKAQVPHSTHALVSWWYQMNFPGVSELTKKIGASLLALILCFQISSELYRHRRCSIHRRRQEKVFVESLITA